MYDCVCTTKYYIIIVCFEFVLSPGPTMSDIIGQLE